MPSLADLDAGLLGPGIAGDAPPRGGLLGADIAGGSGATIPVHILPKAVRRGACGVAPAADRRNRTFAEVADDHR
jgi:hypothetical protein